MLKKVFDTKGWEYLVDRLNSIGSDYDMSFEFKPTKDGVTIKMVNEDDEGTEADLSVAGEFNGQIIFEYRDEEKVFGKVIQQKCYVSNAKAIFGLMYT